MENLSDRELRDMLTTPDLEWRKRAYARELLRRRYDSKSRSAWRGLWIPVFYWVGMTRAALARKFTTKP